MARAHTSQSVFPQANILDFLKRNARLITGVGLFVTFWILVYTFTIHQSNFAAKAVVIIKDSALTSRFIEREQYYAMQTTTSSSSNPVLNTMSILKSSAISDALWEYFKTRRPEQLKKNKIKNKKQWESFYQDGSAFIKAKNQPGTDLISIQFSWTEPVIAKEALTVVVKAFQDASRDLNKEEQISRTHFLNKQVVEIEKELANIRKQKSNYQSKKRTVSVNRESDELAGTRMNLANRLNELESQARGKERMVQRYQQLLGMSPEVALKASAIGQNSSIVRLQDELYRLEQQYSLLSASLTENNPKVREVQAQIDQVKASIEVEQVRTVGKMLSNTKGGIVADITRNTMITNMIQAQGEAQDLRAQVIVLRDRLGQVNRDIHTFPETAEGLANIEQKETSLSTALDQLREKVLEGKLKEEQTLSNVFIVDAPRLPEKAQFPTKTHLIVLSLLLGSAVGITTAFAKEQLFGGSFNLPDWMEPIEDKGPSDDPPVNGNGTGNGNGKYKEPQLVAPALQSQSALKPQNDSVLLPALPIVEETVELPVASLLDALVPVAGPIKPGSIKQGAVTQPPRPDLRRELTQPLHSSQPAQTMQAIAPSQTTTATLSQPIDHPLPAPQPEPTLAESIIANTQPVPHFSGADALLLPPEPPTIPQAKSVKIAAPPSDPSRLERINQPSKLVDMSAELSGVPTLHAAPSAQPIPDSTEAPSTGLSPESSAQMLYNAQIRSMPLPRHRRGIPAFLLDGQESTEFNEVEPAPYTLVSKKQLLNHDDDLMQEVEPLEAMFADETLTYDESRSTSLIQEYVPEPPRTRKPLFGNLLPGKKPSRYPQVYFGIGARRSAQRQLELPGSLNRLMHSFAKSPATIDS